MSKISKSVAGSVPLRFVAAPKGVVRVLENAACRDISLAPQALGLFDAIIGYESTTKQLFRGYAWRLSDIVRFPAGVASAAKKLYDWGHKPGVALNELYLSRATIIKAVARMRRHSPYGRRCLRVARALTKKYLYRIKATETELLSSAKLLDVGILAEATGQPLNARIIRLVEAFKPAVVRIGTSRDFLLRARIPATATIQLGDDGYSVESITFTIEMSDARSLDRRIEGVLYDFSETGTEGLLWSLVDADSSSYESLHVIAPGDHLTISDQLGNRIWAGTIRADKKSGRRRYPRNPKLGQPAALGYWIQWTQKGFKPDDWALFFVRPEYDRCRGVLVKKRSPTDLPHPQRVEQRNIVREKTA